MDGTRTEAEADAALEAAKAFRVDLVCKGVLEPKERDPNFTSDVPGVKWSKEKRKWKVQIYGGLFVEKAMAEAKALELRELHGLQQQVKAVRAAHVLPKGPPTKGSPGIGDCRNGGHSVTLLVQSESSR